MGGAGGMGMGGAGVGGASGVNLGAGRVGAVGGSLVPGEGMRFGAVRAGGVGIQGAQMGGAVVGGAPGDGVVVQPNAGCGCGGDSTGCCVGGPDASCGGAGGVCCEEAGNIVSNTGWSYVGPSAGDYAAGSSTYSYVGQGAGSFTKEMVVTPYGCRLRPCCVALSLLACLLPLLFMYLRRSPEQPGGDAQVIVTPPPTAAPTPPPYVPPPPPPPPTPPPPAPTPPPPPPPVPAPVPAPVGAFLSCTVFGDPHVLSFDNKRADYYSPGEYWIVKSAQIWIQARYLPTRATSGLGVTKILAVGGPLMKGHKLFVSATWAKWDDQPILQGFPP